MQSETSIVTQWVTAHPYELLLICAIAYALIILGLALATQDDERR
jgi:hypothetical protein